MEKTKEMKMKKKLKLLGLAALAVMAIGAFTAAADAIAQNPAGLPFAFCIGIAALSAYICTMAVSRIGATNGWTPSRTAISRSSINSQTGGTTRPATNAMTVVPQLLDAAFTTRKFVSHSDDADTDLGGNEIGQRRNPRNDRIEPTISPVMAY